MASSTNEEKRGLKNVEDRGRVWPLRKWAPIIGSRELKARDDREKRGTRRNGKAEGEKRDVKGCRQHYSMVEGVGRTRLL